MFQRIGAKSRSEGPGIGAVLRYEDARNGGDLRSEVYSLRLMRGLKVQKLGLI